MLFRSMAAHGAALHLPQPQMNAASLATLLHELTRARCLHMAERAYQQGKREANDAIAGVLEDLGSQ
mgnify:FL=1